MNLGKGRQDQHGVAVGRTVDADSGKIGGVVAADGGLLAQHRHRGQEDPFPGGYAAFVPHEVGNGAADPVALGQAVQQLFLTGDAIVASGPDPYRKSTRLNSSHHSTSYAVFCLKKENK